MNLVTVTSHIYTIHLMGVEKSSASMYVRPYIPVVVTVVTNESVRKISVIMYKGARL